MSLFVVALILPSPAAAEVVQKSRARIVYRKQCPTPPSTAFLTISTHINLDPTSDPEPGDPPFPMPEDFISVQGVTLAHRNGDPLLFSGQSFIQIGEVTSEKTTSVYYHPLRFDVVGIELLDSNSEVVETGHCSPIGGGDGGTLICGLSFVARKVTFIAPSQLEVERLRGLHVIRTDLEDGTSLYHEINFY